MLVLLLLSLPILLIKITAQKRKLVEGLDSIEPQSIAAQPREIQAQYLAKMHAKSFSKLSAMELEDIRIPGDYLQYTFLVHVNLTLEAYRGGYS